MFKKLAGLAVVACLFIAGTASAQSIAGTSHDFSNDAFSGGEICIVCHTPHNADTAVAGAPLWNHAVTSSTFTLYSSPTFDGGPAVQPAGQSRLCLSCHDGTVAIDSFGGATGTVFLTGGANLGTDLSGDHPISFAYDAALATADGGLYNPATQNSGLGGTITNDLLFADSLECASCHDVHDDTFDPFLRIANNGSNLCLTCHNK